MKTIRVLKKVKLWALGTGLLVAFFAVAALQPAYAANPNLINFQGKVVNSDGTNVTNGNYTFRFRLYTSTAPTDAGNACSANSCKWEESKTVTVTNGVFQTELGNTTPMIDVSLYTDLYLGILFNGDAAGEMTPRVHFDSAPYALNSDKLGGIAASGFVQLGGTQSGNINIGAGTVTSGAINGQTIGSATVFSNTVAIQGGSALTLGTATTAPGVIIFKTGGANTVTFQGPTTNPTSSYVLKLPTVAPALSECLKNDAVTSGQLIFGTCGTPGVSLQGGTPGVADTGNFNISGYGIAGTAFQTPLIDRANPGILSIGTTNATSISLAKDTTIAAGKYISLVGGLFATRPAVPTAGMLYYDQTTAQLLTYTGTKWQSDRESNTKIVAASNSSQAAKDAADYVADGNTAAAADGDQVQIQAALDAVNAGGIGGKVYLMEGTYVADATILIPNNVTLAGSGRGSDIELADLDALAVLVKNSDAVTGTGVIVQDLRLDGRRDLNTVGSQDGIIFTNMGGGSGSTARPGEKILNVSLNNFSNYGIQLSASSNGLIANSTAQNNAAGIVVSTNSTNITLSSNLVQGNSVVGINITGGTTSTIINGNILEGNTTYGLNLVTGGGSNTVTGNTFKTNSSGGVQIANSNSNTLSGNKFFDNGGAAANEAILISDGDYNNISGNSISDTSATTTNYPVDLSSSSAFQTTLSANTIDTGTINDLGLNTIYANQADSSGNLINRSGGGGTSIGKTSANSSLDVQGGLEVNALPTPASPTLAVVGTVGATTMRYQITALDGLGETLPSTIVQVTTANATLSAVNYVNVSWTPIGGAVQYKIYRCTAAACTPALLTTLSGNVTAYKDIANGAPAGAMPVANTTGGASLGGSLQFADADSSNYVAFKSSAVVASNVTWTLPAADSAGCLKSDGSGTLSFAACGDTNIQTFAASGTYSVQTNALMVIIEAWGGGGGGGGGAGGTLAAARTGGGGGGGGAYNTTTIAGSALASNVPVTIGAGGTAGAGGSNAVGTSGGAGGTTCFSSTAGCAGTMYLQTFGGGGGAGTGATGNGGGGGGGTQSVGGVGGVGGGAGGSPLGSAAGTLNSGSGGAGGTSTVAAVPAGASSNWGGGGGAASSSNGTGNSGTGGGSNQGGAAGGAGGSCAITTCTLQAGGAGGHVPGLAGGGGAGGAIAGQAGTAGAAGVGSGGDGGGGGANRSAAGTVGGVGGAGGARGGGAGGGGASAFGSGTNVGGAGGVGGAGYLRVWTLRGAGADLAEIYCTNDPSLIAGDAVSIDPTLNAGVQKTSHVYDSNAIGIVSTNPGLVIGDVDDDCAKPVLIALAGRVPLTVSLENGPIKPGDSLAASSTPGVAMKATKAGTVIGQAMTAYDGTMPSPTVVAFVQNHESNGVGLTDLIPGLINDSEKPVSQQALEYLVANKDNAIDKQYVSEITTDRLTAGLEIIAPSVVTDALTTNTIGSSGGGDISFILSDQNKLVVKGKSGAPGFTVDATGNATFGVSLTSLGEIESKGGLTVNGDALFGGKSTFQKLAQFQGDIQIAGRATFNKDAGGLATISKGASRVSIVFEKPYDTRPMIGISLLANQTVLPDGTVEDQVLKEQRLFDAGYSYLISNSSAEGFTIVLNKKASEDLQFNWNAIAIKDPVTTVGTATEATSVQSTDSNRPEGQ